MHATVHIQVIHQRITNLPIHVVRCVKVLICWKMYCVKRYCWWHSGVVVIAVTPVFLCVVYMFSLCLHGLYLGVFIQRPKTCRLGHLATPNCSKVYLWNLAETLATNLMSHETSEWANGGSLSLTVVGYLRYTWDFHTHTPVCSVYIE